ncbi:MAG: PhzF family phenazine biosynthesis protein [Cyanobacterium sp. T60_A2020_053]|nr:PhzF family phenazine biosynthesis protein [Cyanobacterium sp. T60_A2020_053]
MKYYTLDVFTEQIFSGNQLAVFPDAQGLSSEIMQKIAIEFNFSETVFVFPAQNAEANALLRIFTPGGEIPFAGHPTIGTAYLLAKLGQFNLDSPQTEVILEEKAGLVPVMIESVNGIPTSALLTAPLTPEFYPQCPAINDLAQVLSLSEKQLQVEGWQPMAVSCGLPFLIIPVRDVEALKEAKINQPQWERVLKDFWAPHVYPFVKLAENEYRVRMFAPALNITEDPATGSAASAFAGYLTQRETAQEGRWAWQIYQGEDVGRCSRLGAHGFKENGIITKVQVKGASVIVTSGELFLAN